MTRADLLVLSGGDDVHVGAGPEVVAFAPLQGLADQPDGAVGARQLRGEFDHAGLGAENNYRLEFHRESNFFYGMLTWCLR